MSPRARRDAGILGVAAVLGLIAPLVLAHLVGARLHDRVEPALSAALGEPVRIGDVELELLGTLRLQEVRVGDKLRADAVEASVGLGTLLRGSFAADEIRVERPRLAARLLPDGSLDLPRRLPARTDRRTMGGGPAAAAPRRLRRILVTGGELVVKLEHAGGRGEIRATNVELHPQEDGVRVVTGALTATLRTGALVTEAAFARSGLDVTLPSLRVGRAALDGGRATVRAGDDPPLALEELVLVRLGGGEETRLEGRLAGSGRPLALRLTRHTEGAELEVQARGLPLASFQAALPAWLNVGAARAGGRLGVRISPTGEVAIALASDLEGVRLDHELLAAEPLPLDGRLSLDGRWDRAARQVAVGVRLDTAALTISGTGELAWDGGGQVRRLRAEAGFPETACATALASVPRPLRGRVDGLELEGTVSGRARVAFDVATPDASVLDLDLDVRCKVLADPPAADVRRLRGAYGHALPNGRIRTMADSDDDFVPLSRLPHHVSGAFVAGEDARFFEHAGFDEVELRRSFAIDVAARRIERGGSTISQQLVKNLWLGRERTLGRKLLEAILTWRLEAEVGKRRILEVYLNLVELGEGLYGVGPAARRWFGKRPRDLTIAEAAFLAALTPAPVSTERRLRDAGGLDARTLERVHAVLRAMRKSHVIDEVDYQEARRGPLRLRL